MIKGYYRLAMDRDAHEIALIDRDRCMSYTIEFRAHKYERDNFSDKIPLTTISRTDNLEEMLTALASVMRQMDLLDGSATDAELKATKYHLEDMRELAKRIK